MYAISWFYLYGVGGLLYAAGTYWCVRLGVLDFSEPRERVVYLWATICLAIFAGIHALFQFVLPFAGT